MLITLIRYVDSVEYSHSLCTHLWSIKFLFMIVRKIMRCDESMRQMIKDTKITFSNTCISTKWLELVHAIQYKLIEIYKLEGTYKFIKCKLITCIHKVIRTLSVRDYILEKRIVLRNSFNTLLVLKTSDKNVNMKRVLKEYFTKSSMTRNSFPKTGPY